MNEEVNKRMEQLMSTLLANTQLPQAAPPAKKGESSAQKDGFQKLLEQKGVNATIRRELGSDIAAACGQLRRRAAAVEPCTARRAAAVGPCTAADAALPGAGR